MKFLVAALALSSSVAAFAQPGTVGVLDNIKGIVSVSSNGVVNSVVGSTSLTNGSVILNSNNASSLVRLTNGCTVGLKASQVLTVNSAATCADLMASVKNVGAPVVMADGDSFMNLTRQQLMFGIVTILFTGYALDQSSGSSGGSGNKVSGS